MRHGDFPQTRILGLAELLMLALHDAHRRRPAQPTVCTIHFDQPRHVLTAVLHRESPPPVAHRFHHSFGAVLADQPRGLGHTQACHLDDVGSNRSSLLLALRGILLGHQDSSHPTVQFGPVLALELDGLAALEELSNLLSAQRFCVLHTYLHPAAERPTPSHFQDHLVLESSPVSGSSCIGQFWRKRYGYAVINYPASWFRDLVIMRRYSGIGLLIVGSALALVYQTRHLGLTVDETSHFAAAYTYWLGEDVLLPADAPPLTRAICGWVCLLYT